MASSTKWLKRSEDLGLSSPSLEIPDLVWELLTVRGITNYSEVKNLMKSSLKELTSPFNINNMEAVVTRLISAFKGKENICLYADFDLDGTSGLALLKKGLEYCGFENVNYYQPKRLSEGYGVHAHAIETLVKEKDIQLFVTIDVGITDIVAADKAKELGVDMIVTDHHLPKEKLPNVLAILNPNVRGCESDLGHLCGAGVAFYLVMALKNRMSHEGILINDFNIKELLDCFAIGTLTDMVPLVRENRSLVKHGLVELAKTKRPGLKVLLKELGLWGKPLTGSDVAIRFAPKLNALSRMEKEIFPIDVFLVETEKEAQKLVSGVMKTNNERVKLQKSAEKEAFDKTFEDHDHFVWVYSENFHQGIIGLVATKLAQAYSVPAFVGAVHSDGRITGSARLPELDPSSLLDAMGEASGHLVRFGGHAPAAGFEVNFDNAENFRESLRTHYEGKNQKELQEPTLIYDVVTDLPKLSMQAMDWLDQIGPFGTQFEFPVLRFNDLSLMNVRELKGGHIKLSVKDSEAKLVRDALWFSPNKNHNFFHKTFEREIKIDLLAEPQWNHYQGRKSIQLLVKDIRIK